MVVNEKWVVFPSPLKIRHKGDYDIKGLFQLFHKWYSDNQYEYHEGLYKDKVETALGNEIEVKMKGSRRVSEYYKYEVSIQTHEWEAKDMVVKVDGQDKEIRRGRIHIEVNGKVITDWQGKFKEGTIWEKGQKWMENHVIKKDIEFKHIDPLDKQLHEFVGEIKRFLKIESS
ncbi:hypothetical protein JW826_03280 [Candidatus Woesearchaeota archaeon]|nr:hypothetical protein [Candidatus Woesearchaeota archaeon]